MDKLQELFEEDVLQNLATQWRIEKLSDEYEVLKEAVEKGVPFEGTLGTIRVDLSTTSELARNASVLARLAHNRLDVLEKYIGFHPDNRIPQRKRRWWQR